jgi:asparagine synthase (glutamine-hydrolysing)
VSPYSSPRLDASDQFDHLGRALYDDFHNGVLPRILKNFDAMSMAHGVEVRTPFLDYRLVNFAFSLPSASKIDRGYTKLVLRGAMKGILPDEIRLARNKIGFTSPVADWFRDAMRPWIEDCLADPACSSDLVDKARLRCAYEAGLRAGRFDWAEALEIWKYLSALKLQAVATLPHGRRGPPARSPEWAAP